MKLDWGEVESVCCKPHTDLFPRRNLFSTPKCSPFQMTAFEVTLWGPGNKKNAGWQHYFTYLFVNVYLFFILREKEWETAWVGEGRGGAGGERIPSRVCAEPDVGLHLRNLEIMIWMETESQKLNRQSHPGTPYFILRWRASFYLFSHLFGLRSK